MLFKNIKKLGYLFLLLQFIACNKTNWTENYKEKSKDPFGLYIINNEFENLLNNEKVHYLNENIYDYLFHNYEEPSSDFASYVCIKDEAHKLTKNGIDSLLSFVYNGNNAFLSLSTNFSKVIKLTASPFTN